VPGPVACRGTMRVVGDGRGGEEPSTDTDAHRRAPGVLAAEVWAVLARAGRPLNAAEVQEGLSRPLTYSTVITTLGRLHTKGLLSRVRDGRSHRYAPVADEAGMAVLRMRRVLDEHADRGAVLTRFVSELSADDEAVVRRLLADHPQDDPPVR
jgi:predicted transcriptional regulator